METIQSVLLDKKAAPEARFYALFFLKMTTEHTNPMLISELAPLKTLFKNLEEQATFDKSKKFPEKGSNFFSTKPTETEKTTGSNYLALLHEMIKFWNFKYGGSEKGENAFKTLYR